MSVIHQAPITKLRKKMLEIGGPAYRVAERAGFPASRMSEYTLGRKPIPVKHLVALCRVFNCDPEDITGWAD